MKDYFVSLGLMGLLVFSSKAYSYPWTNFKNQTCNQSLETYSSENNFEKLNFREVLPDNYKERVFRANGPEIGSMYELHFESENLSKIVTIKNEELKIAKLDVSNCLPSFVSENFPWHLEKIFKSKRANEFNDSDLAALIKTNNKGLIYLWSPKFAYSVEYLPEIYKIAKKMKLNLTFIADPRVSDQELSDSVNKVFNLKTNPTIRTIASNDKIKILKSYDLYLRSGFNHFPVMYYYQNGKIHPHWITGLMTSGGMKEMVHTFQKDLK